MSMTAMGIGSGLDVNSLVSQLVDAERAPQQKRLDLREAETQAKISAFGTIKGILDELESPLKKLANFNPSYSATVANPQTLSVTTGRFVNAGNYSIEVTQLAQSQTVATAAFDEFQQGNVGTGTLTLTVGDRDPIDLEIKAGSNSIGDVRDAINNARAGVTASLFNTGDGMRLVLTADEGGDIIKLQAAAGATGALYDIDLDGIDNELGTGGVTQRGLQAEATINGIAVTSTTNTLNDAVRGLNIELLQTGTTNVRVSTNNEEIPDLLGEFVEKYNELVENLKTLTDFNTDTNEAAVLTGDSTARGIRGALGNALMTLGNTQDGNELSLATLGIVSNRDGTLGFNRSQFDDAFNNSFFDSETFTNKSYPGFGADNVTAAVSDIADNLLGAVTRYTDTFDGVIALRNKGLNNTLKSIDSDRERLDQRMFAYQERTRQQFLVMDTLIAQMSATSQALDSLQLLNNNMNQRRR